jgi:hypothetical protein
VADDAGSLDTQARRPFRREQRQSCATKTCFATFAADPADQDAIRHCNRAGPDGGHAHRWDGQNWQLVAGKMQHDRS